MATVAAVTHNPLLKTFHKRLLAAGKAGQVALTACMRKLLTILNAILQDNRPWNPALQPLTRNTAAWRLIGTRATLRRLAVDRGQGNLAPFEETKHKGPDSW